MRVRDPDDYLRTSEGRVYTDERNAAAWEKLYFELELLLRNANYETRLFIVMGVQGGGKTTWIRENHSLLGPAAVCLDAAVPARRHRARALALAKRFGVQAVGVWINTPLEHALAQNARRPPDQIVPEVAIRSVFEQFEAPSVEEGFDRVFVVNGGARDA